MTKPTAARTAAQAPMRALMAPRQQAATAAQRRGEGPALLCMAKDCTAAIPALHTQASFFKCHAFAIHC